MILSIVVAIALDGAIGRGMTFSGHLPADLKRFKELTTGHTILMGRKTSTHCLVVPYPTDVISSSVAVFPLAKM